MGICAGPPKGFHQQRAEGKRTHLNELSGGEDEDSHLTSDETQAVLERTDGFRLSHVPVAEGTLGAGQRKCLYVYMCIRLSICLCWQRSKDLRPANVIIHPAVPRINRNCRSQGILGVGWLVQAAAALTVRRTVQPATPPGHDQVSEFSLI
jgi:hypothetical protein